MAKPRKLDSYPLHFWALSKAALQQKDKFPMTLSFDTPKQAMAFRVDFYEFRRALRASQDNASKNGSFSSDEAIALSGAELITSPRIDYSAPTGTLIFTLQEKRETNLQGSKQLDAILFGSSSSEASPSPQRGRPKATPITDDDSPLFLSVPYKGQLYNIPLSDIPDNKQEMTGTKLVTLVANGLCDLKQPLASYIVKPSSDDSVPLQEDI